MSGLGPLDPAEAPGPWHFVQPCPMGCYATVLSYFADKQTDKQTDSKILTTQTTLRREFPMQIRIVEQAFNDDERAPASSAVAAAGLY